MKIAVFGCGYVGLTTAVGLAEIGNVVIAVDTNKQKIQLLQKGEVPFYEPGLQELLLRNLHNERLSFLDDAIFAIEQSDVILCAVGTPPAKNQHTDISAVLKVAQAFGKFAHSEKFFINKSTVPVGTSEEIRKTITASQKSAVPFHILANPEFLREGSALKDFFQPDRIIIGLEDGDTKARKVAKTLYRPLINHEIPIVFTDTRNAEIIKYASNAFLATKVSFMNELADFCEKTGANIKDVARGVGLDKRIGSEFLEAGIGFGGSCLPKDVHALLKIGKKYDCAFPLISAVKNTNQQRIGHFINLLKTYLPTLKGKKIALWGGSFKPNTDDIREAPSLKIIEALLAQKAIVSIFDPAALANLEKVFGTHLQYGQDAYEILKDADALLIITQWHEFSSPDFEKIATLMKEPFILDGRNIYDPEEVASYGIEYLSIGRKSHAAHHHPRPPTLSSARKLKSSRSRVKLGL